MSFLSASVPRKVSDNQFIGDLMNLFERRKIKTGDSISLENFASTLASNDAFRSQLFTLCTAISHLAAEDLSGEQLLDLVARALGGPGLPKRGGAVEVPDDMRSAFLTGYDAWTNRTFEPKEPLPWPTPKQPEHSEEPLPTPQPADAEPAASRPAFPGARTVQEALDIARERTLADLAAQPSSHPDASTSTEGLTLSELKALLEEIENRVKRLQPHLHDLTSATHSPADAFARRAAIHEIDAAAPLDAVVPAAGIETPPAVPPIDAAAPPLAADAAPGQATHRASRPSRINEAAFLARHAYLAPTGRAVQDSHATGVVSAPAVAPLAAPRLPTSIAPLLAVTPAATVAVVPSPAVAAMPVPSELSQAAHPVPAAPPAAVPAAAVPPPTRPDPPPHVPWEEPASLAMGRLRVTPRMATGTFITFAALIVVISGLAGLFIYPSLHPKTINDYPDLKPPAQSDNSSPGSSAPGDAASRAQVILAAPGDPSMAPYSPPSSHSRQSTPAKPRAQAPQPPPVAVWPYTNQATIRDAVAPPSTSSAPNARRAQPPAPPLYVPSTTMIAYALSAPQPSYPKDQPRGISGTVVVQIAISQDGYVTEIRVVSGPVEMRPATVQAVQAWRFKPYLVNGTPAQVTTTLGFLFKGQ
jgi:TonB family protein